MRTAAAAERDYPDFSAYLRQIARLIPRGPRLSAALLACSGIDMATLRAAPRTGHPAGRRHRRDPRA